MRTLRILSFFAVIVLIFNACQKEYSLEGGNITLLPGTWEFRDSNILYRGNMDTGFVETNGSTKTLRLQGTSFDGLENFELILNTNNPAFTTGTYMASNGEAYFEYIKGGSTLYEGSQLFGEFIVTITSINSTSVTGTFTGFANDSSNNIKTITAGKFTSRYDDGTSTGDAIGSLGHTGGVCTPITTSGTYTQGTPLDATNTAEVTVNITQPGIYNITTNTANGITFAGSGTFTTTGSTTVKLTGAGTPTSAGLQTYTVSFSGTTCTFQITFVPSGPPSVGTLGGGPGACTPATPAGSYTQGTPLNSANTVTIQADVTTIGSYNITTAAVNGVTFSKAGSFTGTGPQPVVLVGSGTPTNSGAQTFTVTYGTSTCTFSITFAAATATDYFPMTTNSNWVYYGTTGIGFDDSSKYTATALTTAFGGNTYNRFHYEDLSVPGVFDTSYFRKTPNNYFELTEVQQALSFDQPTYVDVNFLRDNVPVGNTWQTPTINGTTIGAPTSGYFKFTILEKGAAVVNSISYPDVIKVKIEVFKSVTPTTPTFTLQQWFAKGVGVINFDFMGADQSQLKRYQIF